MLSFLWSLFSAKPTSVQVPVKAHLRDGRRVKAHKRTVSKLPGEIEAEQRRQKEAQPAQKRAGRQKATPKPTAPRKPKTRQKPYRSPDLPRWNPAIWYEAEQILLHIDNFKHLARYSGAEKRLAIQRVKQAKHVVSHTALWNADELEAWMRKTPELYE